MVHEILKPYKEETHILHIHTHVDFRKKGMLIICTYIIMEDTISFEKKNGKKTYLSYLMFSKIIPLTESPEANLSLTDIRRTYSKHLCEIGIQFLSTIFNIKTLGK